MLKAPEPDDPGLSLAPPEPSERAAFKHRRRALKLRKSKYAEKREHAMIVYALEREGLMSPSERPRNRTECIDGPRPCPWVSCRFHLWQDLTSGGRIKPNAPGVEVADLNPSCALDVADAGGMESEEIAKIFRMTRGAVRQILKKGLMRIIEANAEREMGKAELQQSAEAMLRDIRSGGT